MEIAAPAFSVCMPVFNGQATLGQAIESVLAQSFADFELILVDDASGDGTYEVALEFHHDRVRCFRNDKNRGLYGNHNRCLELARSDWVVFLHQDDTLAPNCLAAYSDALAQWQGSLAVAFGLLDHLPVPPSSTLYEFPKGFLLLVRHGGGLTPSGTLYWRPAVWDCEGFDERHMVADMALVTASRGFRIGQVASRLVHRPCDSTFPKMVASGEIHWAMRYVIPRVFGGPERQKLIEGVLNDLPQWRPDEIASLLRRLAQGGDWRAVEQVERACSARLGSVRREADYWHVRALRTLGPAAYWPLLSAAKRALFVARRLARRATTPPQPPALGGNSGVAPPPAHDRRRPAPAR